MTSPTADQVRRIATLADGTTAYEVTTTVVDAGDLPTRALFVLNIVEPLNPRADVLARIAEPRDLRRLTDGLHVRVTSSSLVYIDGDPFARVANMADLTTLVADRTEAVRRGATQYLSVSLSLVYNNSDTADAAARQLITRLSDLVTSWRTYATSFETTPTERYLLPVVGLSVEAERRAAYLVARAARVRAEEAQAVAQAAYTSCDTGCSQDRAIHALLVADIAFLERAQAVVAAITESGTANAQDFVLRQGAYGASVESYAYLLSQKQTSRDAYAVRLQACASTCAARRVERDEAQAEVSRALADENRALASVRAVCPTFIPSE